MSRGMPGSALVVGAGIGGLAAALALHRAGWSVRVLERAEALGEVGAGLTLSPNAMHAIRWLGIEPAMRERLSLPPYQMAEDPHTGAETGRLVRGEATLREYGAPYAFTHRADLHEVLAHAVAALGEHTILTGRACVEAGSGPDHAWVRTADGETFTADLVIGADGLRSAVRASVAGAEMPRFTGFVAWRGLLPYDAVPEGALPAGSAITYGPGRCMVRYRLEPRRLMNFVAFAPQPHWAEESWSVEADPEVPARIFDEWHPALSAVLRASAAGSCHCWGLFDRDPLPTYAFGRIGLLGDAAHPMLPFLGLGAALALEDAVVLGRIVAVVEDPVAALNYYSEARQPRGSAAQLEARRAAWRLHGRGEDPREVNEETLDYFRYDPASVPVAGLAAAQEALA
jgi:salicylate hydroxylase